MAEKKTMSDVLRQAIADSGKPLIVLERETGVQRMSISRFLAGTQSLRLDVADRLADFFGLELRLKRKVGKPWGPSSRNK
jgi:plasmid maintenance system antidote protein VapI